MRKEQRYIDGWLEMYGEDGEHRTKRFTDEAIFDVILNCGPGTEQVQTFAQKHSMSESHIRGLRNGNRGKEHWKYLKEHGIIDT